MVCRVDNAALVMMKDYNGWAFVNSVKKLHAFIDTHDACRDKMSDNITFVTEDDARVIAVDYTNPKKLRIFLVGDEERLARAIKEAEVFRQRHPQNIIPSCIISTQPGRYAKIYSLTDPDERA